MKSKLSSLALFLVPMAVVVSGLWSVIAGERTLFFRDIFSMHLPAKLAQAEAWRQGDLPVIDVYRAGGQPSLGNLNTLPLYPDNLLYLLTPDLWAFNAHYWLHLLLAPLACFWLARRWGLGHPAAWTAGFTYGTGGYLLSQMNFYNLMPGVALAPALIAACLGAVQSASGSLRRQGCRLVSVAGLWALLLLGGDPILALEAALLAIAAVLFTLHGSWRRSWVAIPRLTAAALAGGLLALPQYVELARILGWSYRGFQGFSEQIQLIASWSPLLVVEWFLPLAFGRPNRAFWGWDFFGGEQPLFFSLYPGVLVLALVMVSGLVKSRPRLWAWMAIGSGLFLALGAHNPLVRLLLRAPGGELLRFPVKFWLAVALGSAILAGLGIERAVSDNKLRQLLRALGGLALLMLSIAALLQASAVESYLRELVPPIFTDARVTEVRMRWLGDAVLTGLLALAYAALLGWGRRRLYLAMTAVLALHVAAQLFLLRSLLMTDAHSAYREPPQLLAQIGRDETLVQGGISGMFGDPPKGLRYPDRHMHWVQRRAWSELYPFAGVQFQRRYELNVSPEGLDSFLAETTLEAMRQLSDAERLRVLRALAVDVLILDRPLEPEPGDLYRVRAERPHYGIRASVYELLGSADPYQVLGSARTAPHVNGALTQLLDPGFDPRETVVLAGIETPRVGERGRLEVLKEEREEIEVRVWCSTPSILVLPRSHLPLYRASVDGEEVGTRIANISRLALEVPAGEHTVRVWVDDGGFYWAFLGWPVALLLLLAATRWRAGDHGAVTALDTSTGGDRESGVAEGGDR